MSTDLLAKIRNQLQVFFEVFCCHLLTHELEVDERLLLFPLQVFALYDLAVDAKLPSDCGP